MVLSPALLARVHAQSQQLSDVKGSKDPAAIERYEGSVIIGYKFSKFDEFTSPVSSRRPIVDRVRLPQAAEPDDDQHDETRHNRPSFFDPSCEEARS